MKKTLRSLSAGLRITAAEYAALNGSAEQAMYIKQPNGSYVKTVRAVAGLKKAWNKALKFTLVLDANVDPPMYLTPKGGLTSRIKEARFFAFGFDTPHVKEQEWNRKTKLNFKHVTYYGTTKNKEQ